MVCLVDSLHEDPGAIKVGNPNRMGQGSIRVNSANLVLLEGTASTSQIISHQKVLLHSVSYGTHWYNWVTWLLRCFWASIVAAVNIRANYTNSQLSVTLAAAKSKVACRHNFKKGIHSMTQAMQSSFSGRAPTQCSNGTSCSSGPCPCLDIVVLSWLDHSTWLDKTCVGNWFAAILELLPASAWRHVPTSDNPADCPSQGMLPQQLIQHKFWWEWPPWLHHNPSSWPQPTVLPVRDGL